MPADHTGPVCGGDPDLRTYEDDSGDPARAVAGPQASVQDVEKLRESMGLNEPMLVQYKDYVLGVLQGTLGHPIPTTSRS